MPVDPDTGVWIPRLSPRQLQIFNTRRRYVLCSGPRYSGKTIGVLHRIIRHAWETPDARVAMFARTVKNAKSGVWADITGPIIHEWLDAELASEHAEFEYTVPPKIDGATRMHYFRIRNYWGGESEVQLHSLDFDGDIEEKVFATRYSLIYFSELQHFNDPAIFRTAIQQLRMPALRFDQHLWIADTNPPDVGQEHFAYQIWFVERIQQNSPDPEFQQDLDLIEFTIEDNIYGDPRAIAALKATYRYDQEGWNRFILGKWNRITDKSLKHFGSVFSRELHVAGHTNGEQADWEYLNPTEETTELITGWDLGHLNHAFHILNRRLDAQGNSQWDILDELVSVGEKVFVDEFAGTAIEKIEAMEKLIGNTITWRHWSDTSAFRFNAGGMDDMDAAIVERVSRGRIRFLPAISARSHGALRKRVALVRQLLGAKRIMVSAHCVKTIEMFEELRKGAKELDYIMRGDPNKHPFDSMTYAIYSEMLEDLEVTTAQSMVSNSRLAGLAL